MAMSPSSSRRRQRWMSARHSTRWLCARSSRSNTARFAVTITFGNPERSGLPFFYAALAQTRAVLRPHGAFRLANGAHFAAAAAAAEEAVGTIGFQSRYSGVRGHFQAFENFAGLGIDAPHVAFIVFPGAVPEFAVDP